MMLARRLALITFVAGLGYAFAEIFHLHELYNSSAYFVVATVLLSVGLFSSTYDISLHDVRSNIRIILVAITFGVLVKAAFIAAVMYVVFRDPAYIVVAVAVAQIDPLSVSVMRYRFPLSAKAKAILSVWSSFDDPVTAILVVYLSGVALYNIVSPGVVGPPGNDWMSAPWFMDDGLSAFGQNLLGNILLVACAGVVWLLLRWVGKRTNRRITDGPGPKSPFLQFAAILSLVAAAFLAVYNFLMLGLAAIGLFFRPGIGAFLARVTPVVFMLATFALGLVIVDGIHFVPGLVLGCATFGAQVVVGMLVARSLPLDDRVSLALGQQSGITAVILALLLEAVFPGSVAVVAPAILVINVLHLIANTVWGAIQHYNRRPDPDPPAHDEDDTSSTAGDRMNVTETPPDGSHHHSNSDSAAVQGTRPGDDRQHLGVGGTTPLRALWPPPRTYGA